LKMVRNCIKLLFFSLFSLHYTSCINKGNDSNLPVSSFQYNISPSGDGIVFNANPEELSNASKDGITYQWYKGNDSHFDNAKPIKGATSATYNTGKIAKGIHFYFCVISESQKNDTSATTLCPFSVAFTGLPLVEINTVDNEEPTAEYVSYEDYGGNYGRTLRNATKVPASMRIISNKGKVLYESGEYTKGTSGLKLKLRGNTSAYSDKKPYKITLQKKADLLKDICVSTAEKRVGEAYEDTDWLLLKEATCLKTFVSLTVADIAGMPWTPKFAYVDVVVNGSYRGIYHLMESVKRSEKRINVNEDGWIIERDSYWWNEDIIIVTDSFNQKYTFKYPKPKELQENEFLYMKNYLANVELSVLNGTYDQYIDVPSFARWALIHDILCTADLGGSNQFFTKLDTTSNSRLELATPWDFDSTMEEKDIWSIFHIRNRGYFKAMLNSTNSSFSDSYCLQWESIAPKLWAELHAKLEDLKARQGEALNLSREYDALRWNTENKTVENELDTIGNWFTHRIEWLNSHISKDAIGFSSPSSTRP